VLPQLGGRRALPPTGLAGVQPAPSQLLAVLLHVRGQLALQRELIPTLRADEVTLQEKGRGCTGFLEHNVAFYKEPLPFHVA